jgi:hypothetical protein
MESDLSASSALEALLSAPNAERAVPTLQTLFLNILCSPDEPKFRRLRASNPALQAKLLSVAGAVELLRAVGFVEEGDFFVLAPGLALPQAVIERIAAVAEELAATAPTADEAGGGGGGDAGGGGGGGGGGAAGGASRLPPATLLPLNASLQHLAQGLLMPTQGPSATKAVAQANRDLEKLIRALA